MILHRLLNLIWFVFSVLVVQISGNKDCDCRLPNTIIPQKYHLEIITHLENDNFNVSGRVQIKVVCHHVTKSIILHSVDLLIEEKSVRLEDLTKNATISIESFKYDKENEFLIINTFENLSENHDYLISIPFTGKLNDDLDGFYKSSYIDNNTGEKKWLAVTQFEATSARTAFPCFDEPAMKATFKISLGRTGNHTSISNMPLAATKPMEDTPGWFWDHFEETVPMSTYLVAFAISNFEYISASTKAGTKFRVWAKSESIQQVDFAKSIGPLSLEYFETFFNISYPLPKVDMIAVPDYDHGAMENWGLIVYKESALLYDPATSSASFKISVADTVSHELAHQWFGNLVTMNWWSDLWLNEGFATYMAILAVDHILPQWNYYKHETVNNLLSVFLMDSLRTSHPVSVPISDPDEIDELFDTISYEKGSVLLHMMVNFLGKKTFQMGVSNYLSVHKYSNAQQDDLWRALTFQAHHDNVLPKNITVKDIMDTWTLQTGYPVITVTRDYQSNSAKLSQERFLRDTSQIPNVTTNCWWVPITYTTQVKSNFNVTLPEDWLPCPIEDDYVIQGLPSAKEWVIFNLQGSGLYRVNYDVTNWKLLTSTLNSDAHHTISLINKILLIDDSANLAWIGSIPYTIHFDILQYLKHEQEYLPWSSGLDSVITLDNMLTGTPIYRNFKLYVRDLLTPIYKHIGGFKPRYNTDDNLEAIKHQIQITTWSCKFEVENCSDEAMKLFKDWMVHPTENRIPKDLRSVVYCNAMSHGGEKEWNFLWERYQASNLVSEKETILEALGCTKQGPLLQRYLEWTINSNSTIRVHDCPVVLEAMTYNHIGFNYVRNFLETRIGDIHKYLGTSIRKLDDLIRELAKQITSEDEYKKFKQFTEENKDHLSDIEQTIKQALETVTLNIQWQAKHYKEIKKLLQEYSKSLQ